MSNADSAARIGHLFRIRLRVTIGPVKFQRVLALNEDDDKAAGHRVGSCRSHDFVDANVLMADAYRSVMGYAPFDANHREPTQADTDLWNAAWDAADLRRRPVLAHARGPQSDPENRGGS